MAWHRIGAKPFYFHYNRTKKQTYFNGQGISGYFRVVRLITKCIPDGQPWKGYLQGRVSDPTFWLHVTSRVSNPGRVIYVEGHTPPQI